MNVDQMEWPLSKEELEYLYLDKKISTIKIGNKFNKSYKTVIYWMKKYKIDRRDKKLKKQ